jgi:hypothetical protein
LAEVEVAAVVMLLLGLQEGEVVEEYGLERCFLHQK